MIIDTSETNEPDLFWAIRGGSNQFGIVTEFVFKAYPLASSATVGVMVYPGTELADVLRALRTYLQIQDKTSKMILAFARAPPHFYPGLLILPYIEDVHKTDTILAPFREIVKPIFEGVGPAPNFSAVAHAADDSLKGVPPRQIIDGALFSDLWEDVVSKAFGDWIQFTEQPQFRATVCMWEFWHQEKIAETDVGKMAFAARDPHYYVVVTGRHTEESDDSTVAEWTANLAAAVRQAQVEKTGKKLTTPSSFCLDPKYESVEDIYGENLPKLKKLKAKYDPEKIWSKGWLIEPDFT
ncbi:hypothetical protein VKT23_017569 [Stygiomarasmius scandens]|uniref:Berberine/berberine-like domain-containing protein n=1 Tax=Marasmiellus scandens TaxID=2682957 RepID=A0ABR1IVQ4_9AGAR